MQTRESVTEQSLIDCKRVYQFILDNLKTKVTTPLQIEFNILFDQYADGVDILAEDFNMAKEEIEEAVDEKLVLENLIQELSLEVDPSDAYAIFLRYIAGYFAEEKNLLVKVLN